MKITTLITTITQQNHQRTSGAGNVLYDFSYHNDRYMIDFADDFATEGWQQFDTSQDAWYYGVWVNPVTYQTLSYTEGDITLVVCDGPAAYNREVQSMIDFYEEGMIAMTYGEEGKTIYRQDRAQFLLPESSTARA